MAADTTTAGAYRKEKYKNGITWALGMAYRIELCENTNKSGKKVYRK